MAFVSKLHLSGNKTERSPYFPSDSKRAHFTHKSNPYLVRNSPTSERFFDEGYVVNGLGKSRHLSTLK